VAAVVDVVLVVDELHADHPVPGDVGPVRVGVVVGVAGQAGAQVEEAAVGDGVLVVVAVVGQRDLPAQAAAALVVVAHRAGLRVEDGLGQRQPLRVLLLGVLEVDLGRQHGAHAPEGLVVVAQRRRPVGRHVRVLRARLEQHGLLHQLVVRAVARVVPVVDHGAPERPALPPVVVAQRRRAREDAGDLAALVPVVVGHDIVRFEARRRADGLCGAALLAIWPVRWWGFVLGKDVPTELKSTVSAARAARSQRSDASVGIMMPD